MKNYLGCPAIELDFPGYTNTLSLQRLIGLTEFCTIVPEDDGGEDLCWVRLSKFRNVGCDLDRAA